MKFRAFRPNFECHGGYRAKHSQPTRYPNQSSHLARPPVLQFPSVLHKIDVAANGRPLATKQLETNTENQQMRRGKNEVIQRCCRIPMTPLCKIFAARLLRPPIDWVPDAKSETHLPQMH